MLPVLSSNQLKIFSACAKQSDIEKASAVLGLDCQTVNEAILALEASTGAALFVQTKGGMSLTEAGQMLLSHAKEMEKQSSLVLDKLSKLTPNSNRALRVCLPPALAHFVLAPNLSRFQQLHPTIKIWVQSANRVDDFNRIETDIALRITDHVKSNMVARRLTHISHSAFASHDYLRQQKGLTVGDGTGARWIGWDQSTDWIKSSPFPNAKQHLVLPDVHLQLDAAAHGAGIAWIPTFVGDHDPRLTRIPNIKSIPYRSIWLLLNQDLRTNSQAKAFVKFFSDLIIRDRRRFTD